MLLFIISVFGEESIFIPQVLVEMISLFERIIFSLLSIKRVPEFLIILLLEKFISKLFLIFPGFGFSLILFEKIVALITDSRIIPKTQFE